MECKTCKREIKGKYWLEEETKGNYFCGVKCFVKDRFGEDDKK